MGTRSEPPQTVGHPGRHHPRKRDQRRPRNGMVHAPGRYGRKRRAYDRLDRRARNARRREPDRIYRRILELGRTRIGQRLGRSVPVQRKGEKSAGQVLRASRHTVARRLQRLPVDGRTGADHAGARGKTPNAAQRLAQVRVGLPRRTDRTERLGNAEIAVG